jgi:hypothetical protein
MAPVPKKYRSFKKRTSTGSYVAPGHESGHGSGPLYSLRSKADVPCPTKSSIGGRSTTLAFTGAVSSHAIIAERILPPNTRTLATPFSYPNLQEPDVDVYRLLDQLFEDPRAIPEITPFVQVKQDLGTKVERRIDLFVGNNLNNEIPSYIAHAIRALCPESLLAGLSRGPTDAQENSQQGTRRAWLDDRACRRDSAAMYREYANPLTAQDLYKWLMRQRYGIDSLPDADRRLM